jgi:single-strand DNA-binding protein
MNTPTITFSGNVGAKPELKPVSGPNGPSVVANLRVAVTPRKRGTGADEWVDDETMWFTVSTWRATAANCAASLNPGDRVVVRGRLTQRTWTDANGVDHPTFQVEAEDVALDLTRYPAMSLRRAPAQRAPEAPSPDDVDRWASTGQVDRETGEVLVEPVDQPSRAADDPAATA